MGNKLNYLNKPENEFHYLRSQLSQVVVGYLKNKTNSSRYWKMNANFRSPHIAIQILIVLKRIVENAKRGEKGIYQRYLLHTPIHSHTPTRMFVDLILPPWKVCLFLSDFVLRFRIEKQLLGNFFVFELQFHNLRVSSWMKKTKTKAGRKKKTLFLTKCQQFPYPPTQRYQCHH